MVVEAVLGLTEPVDLVAGAFVAAGFLLAPWLGVAGLAVVAGTFFVAAAGLEDGAGKAFFAGAVPTFFCGCAGFGVLGFDFGGAE